MVVHPRHEHEKALWDDNRRYCPRGLKRGFIDPHKIPAWSRYPEAQASYREALRLNPGYADAHFYLAVTFEKMGQSPDARPHWKAYQELAPQGEWVELAKEFSE